LSLARSGRTAIDAVATIPTTSVANSSPVAVTRCRTANRDIWEITVAGRAVIGNGFLKNNKEQESPQSG